MSQNKKRIFYVHRLPHAAFMETLAARPDVILDRITDETAEATAGGIIAAAHAYQVGASRDELPVRYHASRDLLARAPHLLVASSSGAGFDPIDVAACTAAGVIVVNQSGGNARSVAEHTVGMLLMLTKRVAESQAVLRRGTFESRNALMGWEAFGKTVGIVGIGHTGGEVAKICGGALGMTVLAADPYLDAETIARRGARKVSLDELLGSSDFVSIHTPLNAETRGMIGAREYGLMRPGAIFITTARGFIHDETALVDALASGHIAGAGLDVWASEPPAPDHPLLQFDKVIASPHTAGVTHEARRNMGLIAAEQLLAILDGRCPPRLINPEAWPKYSARFRDIFGFSPSPLSRHGHR